MRRQSIGNIRRIAQFIVIVSNSDNPRQQTDRLPLDFLWITQAIIKLVMLTNNPQSRLREFQVTANLKAILAVQFVKVALGLGERLHLHDNFFRNFTAADIVEQCTHPQRIDRLGR